MKDTIRDVLADLLEWEAIMGGWDAPVWRRARRLMNKIRDREDEQAKKSELARRLTATAEGHQPALYYDHAANDWICSQCKLVSDHCRCPTEHLKGIESKGVMMAPPAAVKPATADPTLVLNADGSVTDVSDEHQQVLTACECDNGHDQVASVCRWCLAHGRRHPNDPEVEGPPAVVKEVTGTIVCDGIVYYCQACEYESDEDDFVPSDGNPAPHICPECGSTNCFPK